MTDRTVSCWVVGYMEMNMKNDNDIPKLMIVFTVIAITATILDLITGIGEYIRYNNLDMFLITWLSWLAVMIALIIVKEKNDIKHEKGQPDRDHLNVK